MNGSLNISSKKLKNVKNRNGKKENGLNVPPFLSRMVKVPRNFTTRNTTQTKTKTGNCSVADPGKTGSMIIYH